MSSVQIYNLAAGLTVLIVMFGGLLVHAFRLESANRERNRFREIRSKLKGSAGRAARRRGPRNLSYSASFKGSRLALVRRSA